MKDIQNSPALVPMPIDRVGVKGLTLPIVVSDKENGSQHSVAEVDLTVDLPAHWRGSHMSRFVEALENWQEELSYQSMKKLLKDVKTRLDAKVAHIEFRFIYFLQKVSPATRAENLMGYNCRLLGEMDAGDKPKFLLEIKVPVMTVCPCSKAISDEGAHSQRADLRIAVRMCKFVWLEEFIEIAESAGSSPVYPLLKREDEKFVTEAAFAKPAFVEDVVRNVGHALLNHPGVSWFRVEVESHESIHAHNAYACIEYDKEAEGHV
ncbi:MAG: GTP cyclohydrolase I FolE2 [Desulfovibrionaceae bacterium]|nr:GTP cyclohydrolase I FolE2 [Desulfovibrionaceae bacterium]